MGCAMLYRFIPVLCNPPALLPKFADNWRQFPNVCESGASFCLTVEEDGNAKNRLFTKCFEITCFRGLCGLCHVLYSSVVSYPWRQVEVGDPQPVIVDADLYWHVCVFKVKQVPALPSSRCTQHESLSPSRTRIIGYEIAACLYCQPRFDQKCVAQFVFSSTED